jgi:two-component system, OmpR family, sensor kinase
MKSLRGRLLSSLLLAVLLVGAVLAAIAYRQVNLETRELLDNQLAQIANIVALQTDPLSPAARRHKNSLEVGIWGPDGKLQYASSAFMRAPLATKPGFTDMILGPQPYRVYTALIDGRNIYIAQPVDIRDDQAETAALAAFLPLLMLLPVLAIVIAWVIRTLLQPMRAVALAVSRREPFDRTALQTRDLPSEVAPVVEELNRLLDRQSEAVQRERHFIADAAHALRTPLAALQLQADVLDGSSDRAERAVRLAELRAGIQRAARLSDQLLSLARIESSEDSVRETVEVDETLREVQVLYQPSAAASRITLRLDAHSRAKVRGHPSSLLLICGNLVDNALRYTPCNGRIELLAGAEGEAARIEIWDEGPGLETEQLGRVFERFYRVPGDSSAGSGLGLASVESLVRQMSGHVSLHNRTDRSGLIARVVLPRVLE